MLEINIVVQLISGERKNKNTCEHPFVSWPFQHPTYDNTHLVEGWNLGCNSRNICSWQLWNCVVGGNISIYSCKISHSLSDSKRNRNALISFVLFICSFIKLSKEIMVNALPIWIPDICTAHWYMLLIYLFLTSRVLYQFSMPEMNGPLHDL